MPNSKTPVVRDYFVLCTTPSRTISEESVMPFVGQITNHYGCFSGVSMFFSSLSELSIFSLFLHNQKLLVCAEFGVRFIHNNNNMHDSSCWKEVTFTTKVENISALSFGSLGWWEVTCMVTHFFSSYHPSEIINS